MVEEGQGGPRCRLHRWVSAISTLLPVVVATAGTIPAHAAEPVQPIRFSEAAELGTFNVGPARAVVRRVPDRTAGGEILQLDYTIPQGAAAGLYAKAFPGGLDADAVDIVRLAIRADDPDQARQIAVAVEIKGAAGVQRISLEIHPDWTPIEELVNWPTIGALKEVVVSVNPTAGGAPAAGSIAIDGRYEKLPAVRKLSMSPLARVGGVLLFSLLVSMLWAALRAVTRGQPGSEPNDALETLTASSSAPESSWVQ
jgi:cyclic beta-1,2-glucan synthetase